MAKKFNIEEFLRKSKEEQAREIEKQTAILKARLPDLKKNLQSYDDTSDELYNLTEDELDLMSTTYQSAVRRGEITTPSSKRAYQRFVKQLQRYATKDRRYLAMQTAKKRMDSWLENVKNNGSKEEIKYAEELIAKMSDKDKQAFTLSKYFLDVNNWSSDDFIKEVGNSTYSMQTLSLEIWCKEHGIENDGIYINNVATDKDPNRHIKGYRQKGKGR